MLETVIERRTRWLVLMLHGSMLRKFRRNRSSIYIAKQGFLLLTGIKMEILLNGEKEASLYIHIIIFLMLIFKKVFYNNDVITMIMF